MDFLIDTANLADITKWNEYIPLSGVTTNPTIFNKEGHIDYFNHLNKIRKIIGPDKELHVQIVASDYEGILKDANTILDKVDKEVYIKIPVTKEGLKAMQTLKTNNVNITATAIYTKFQAYLAIAAGVDCVAPYYNRMENINIKSEETIKSIADIIKETNSSTRILAASFKNIHQVNSAFECGSHSVTVSSQILESGFNMPSIQKAVDDFQADWFSIYGKDSTIATL